METTACDGLVWNATNHETSEDMKAFFFGKALTMASSVPMYYCIIGMGELGRQYFVSTLSHLIQFVSITVKNLLYLISFSCNSSCRALMDPIVANILNQ